MDQVRKNPKRKSSLDHQHENNNNTTAAAAATNGHSASVEKKLRLDQNGCSPQMANGASPPKSPVMQLINSPMELPVEINGTLQFRTEYLTLWEDAFEHFYSEHPSVVVISGPSSTGDEACRQLTLLKLQPSENGENDETNENNQDADEDCICVKFSSKRSQVAVYGSGMEAWKVGDFPQLSRRVWQARKEGKEKNNVQNGVDSPGHQRAPSSPEVSIPAKRYRLSLKANKEVSKGATPTNKGPTPSQQVAPMFKKTSSDAGKITSNGIADAVKSTTRTPCVATLHNLGNTCFLSSVLQVLRYTAGFVDIINTLAEQIKQAEKIGEEKSDSSSEDDTDEEILTWTLIKNLQHVYRQMSEAEDGVSRNTTSYLGIRPYNLLECIEKLNPMYEGSQQQDAHELLHCLLSYIQDGVREVNKRRKCPVKIDRDASVTSTTSPKPKLNGVGPAGDNGGKPLSDGIKTENELDNVEVKLEEKRVHRPGPRRRRHKFRTKGQSSITAFLRPTDSDKLSMSAVVRLDRLSIKRLSGNVVATPTAEPVASLFRGSMELRTRCLDCEGATSRSEDYLDIGVPVTSASDIVNVDDDDEDGDDKTDSEAAWLLSALGEVERLRDVNKYYCSQCLRLVEAERSMHYMTTPPMLTLHLKRFAARSGNFGCITKVTRHVTVPMILPCIQDTCKRQCSNAKHRYQLYAIITHTGISISSGHYVAYVRASPETKHRLANAATESHKIVSDSNNNNNVWYECDDDSARVLSEREFQGIMSPSGGGSPYLLFYCQPKGGATG